MFLNKNTLEEPGVVLSRSDFYFYNHLEQYYLTQHAKVIIHLTTNLYFKVHYGPTNFFKAFTGKHYIGKSVLENY